MKKILLVTSILFLINSCNKAYKLENIDSDLLAYVNSETENPTLIVITEKTYPSSGYQITHYKRISKKEIYVKFKKISVPSAGLAVITPAMFVFDLKKLSNEEYDVVFELDKKKTKGKITIGTSVELTLESGSNIKPK
ncbi:MAG TPA: hypothetical protein PLP27_12115 [Crocinitomicaceae bacterium]|nr:hypothetical protein [Crocinitomicaceae bacterium]